MENYNSTLQSNNTDLQAILNTINELPSAGGGGGSIETCTVEIVADGPARDTIIYWVDGNGDLQYRDVPVMDFMTGFSLHCARCSIIYSTQTVFSDMGGMSSGEVSAINAWCLFVRGDGTFVIC